MVTFQILYNYSTLELQESIQLHEMPQIYCKNARMQTHIPIHIYTNKIAWIKICVYEIWYLHVLTYISYMLRHCSLQHPCITKFLSCYLHLNKDTVTVKSAGYLTISFVPFCHYTFNICNDIWGSLLKRFFIQLIICFHIYCFCNSWFNFSWTSYIEVQEDISYY